MRYFLMIVGMLVLLLGIYVTGQTPSARPSGETVMICVAIMLAAGMATVDIVEALRGRG